MRTAECISPQSLDLVLGWFWARFEHDLGSMLCVQATLMCVTLRTAGSASRPARTTCWCCLRASTTASPWTPTTTPRCGVPQHNGCGWYQHLPSLHFDTGFDSCPFKRSCASQLRFASYYTQAPGPPQTLGIGSVSTEHHVHAETGTKATRLRLTQLFVPFNVVCRPCACLLACLCGRPSTGPRTSMRAGKSTSMRSASPP